MAQLARAPLKVMEDALPVPCLVIRRAWVEVSEPVANRVVEEHCQLASRRRDRLRFAYPRGEPPVEGAEGSLGAPDVDSGDPQKDRRETTSDARTSWPTHLS